MKELCHNTIKLYIAKLIAKALSLDSNLEEVYKSVTETPNVDKGHYCFAPFKLTKLLKKAPQLINEQIIENLTKDSNIIDFKLESNYINFYLSNIFLAENILKNDKKELIKESKKIMIEYSQPNTHKQMHVGHMRNLCLGNALINIQKYVGHDVLSVTYPGDVGTHVAKSLWYIKNMYEGDLPKNNKGEWLADMYVNANNYIEENNKDSEISLILKEIHDKKGEYYDLWKETREWSIDLMKEVYDWTDVKFDKWFFESCVDEDSVKYINKLYKEKKLIKSDGAIGLNLEDKKLGFAMLLKRDGTGLYSTKDIELARKKFEEYDVEESIYIVDNRQSLHFKRVFSVLEEVGFEQAKDCLHLPYEMVELPDGPMSSRKGNIVPLKKLITQMESHIETNYLNKYEWEDSKKQKIKKQIANAAIKYGMINMDNNKKIIFDMKKWLKLDGDTGPYLQYAVVRINSILKKVNSESETDWSLLSKKEIELLLQLDKFDSVIIKSAKQYKTAFLCKYLYDLAKKFSSFYAECSVLKAENESVKSNRLALVKKTKETLTKGLTLLGIEVPEEM